MRRDLSPRLEDGNASWRWLLAIATVALLAQASATLAQLQTGDLYGVVHDNEGNPLPGVTVEFAGQESITNSMGEFSFERLEPGEYSLTASLSTFSTVEYPRISIAANKRLDIEIDLSPEVQEEITVTDQSPLLDARRTNQGRVIDASELEKIPTVSSSRVEVVETAGGFSLSYVDRDGESSPLAGTGPFPFSLSKIVEGEQQSSLELAYSQNGRPTQGRLTVTTDGRLVSFSTLEGSSTSSGSVDAVQRNEKTLVVAENAATNEIQFYEQLGNELEMVGNFSLPPDQFIGSPFFGGRGLAAVWDPAGEKLWIYNDRFTDFEMATLGVCEQFAVQRMLYLTAFDSNLEPVYDEPLTLGEEGSFGANCDAGNRLEAVNLGNGSSIVAPQGGQYHVLYTPFDEPGQSSSLAFDSPVPPERQFIVSAALQTGFGSATITIPGPKVLEVHEDGAGLGTGAGVDEIVAAAARKLVELFLAFDRIFLFGGFALDVSGLQRVGEPSPGAADQVTGILPLPGCADTDRAACLLGNRFRVKVDWQSRGRSGTANARSLTGLSATYWIFDPDNREVLVKALDGCGINGHYWFFASGLTNVGLQLTFWDRIQNQARVYLNDEGNVFGPLLDTEAIPCEGSALERPPAGAARSKAAGSISQDRGPGAAGSAAVAGPAVEAEARVFSPRAGGSILAASDSAAAACGGDANDVCLAGDRFRVEVDWTTPDGASGPGVGGPLGDLTGIFWFFQPANHELIVKILDGCSINGRRWVFATGLTNVGVELRVTDTETGESRLYSNPVRSQYAPITDLDAFGGCT